MLIRGRKISYETPRPGIRSRVGDPILPKVLKSIEFYKSRFIYVNIIFILNLRQITSLDMALFVNRGHYLSASTVIAELAQIDSLPGSHIDSAVSDRNCKAYSKER